MNGFFSEIPTVLGISSFLIFSWLVSHNRLDIPAAVVGAIGI
ncbi:MAG: photosystem II biosynthesis protein [cyanobacterium endosymbiont of Rhopalodia yunnanensis]